MKTFFKIILFWAMYLFFVPLAFARVLVLTDDPGFQELVQRKSDLASQCDQSPSGEACLQVTSQNFYEQSIEGWNFSIKQKPAEENEFRYVLFAWKQQGGKSLVTAFANDGQWGTALSYTAGNPGNTYYKIDVSPQSPSDWNVVVRDLYKDMVVSQFEKNFNHNSSLIDLVITGIAMIPWDGEYAMWDKIILGTDAEELMQVAESWDENLSENFYDPLDSQKEQWDEYIYDSYDWKKVAKGFSKIEKRLNADKKRFLARDAALANAWLALNAFANGKKASTYYNSAQKYLKFLSLPPDTWGLAYFKNLFSQKKTKNTAAPKYVQKIALVVVPEINTDSVEGSFNAGEYKKLLLEWNIVKTFIERNSGGKLSMAMELFLAEGASYRGLTGDGKVDIESIEPYPEDILAEATQNFDVIVYYSPTLTVSSGGMNNSTKKGILTLNRGHSNPDDSMLPLHELVHVYEQFFNLTTGHSFRNDPNYSKKPLQTELSYYENLFSVVIPGKIQNDFQGNWAAFKWH